MCLKANNKKTIIFVDTIETIVSSGISSEDFIRLCVDLSFFFFILCLGFAPYDVFAADWLTV